MPDSRRRENEGWGASERELLTSELSTLVRRRDLVRTTLETCEARIKVLERKLRKGGNRG